MIDKQLIIENLKNVFDPEIPSASLYDLGLIYDIAINEREHEVTITHTLTSAFCPFADEIVNDIQRAGYVPEVISVLINKLLEKHELRVKLQFIEDYESDEGEFAWYISVVPDDLPTTLAECVNMKYKEEIQDA